MKKRIKMYYVHDEKYNLHEKYNHYVLQTCTNKNKIVKNQKNIQKKERNFCHHGAYDLGHRLGVKKCK